MDETGFEVLNIVDSWVIFLLFMIDSDCLKLHSFDLVVLISHALSKLKFDVG